jgi:hypothetical protein
MENYTVLGLRVIQCGTFYAFSGLNFFCVFLFCVFFFVGYSCGQKIVEGGGTFPLRNNTL